MGVKKKTGRWASLSLKRKFYWLVGCVMGLAFLAILTFYLYMDSLMGETRKVLRENDVSLGFQVAMEEERRALKAWAAGESGSAEKGLAEAFRATEEAVEALPDHLPDIGLDQYRATWAIHNSFHTYRQKREELLKMGRRADRFAQELYTLYDMQGYLLQYGTRLTQTVMRKGNGRYLEMQGDFRFMPVALALVGFSLLAILAAASRKMDELFIDPVVRLSKDAGRMAANDFGGSLPERVGEDEMGELIAAYARMKASTASHIEALKENHELQLQLEKVQLQMLKNQMNPHFLFNTLNMISCMAQIEEADVTDRMILSMARLFQYTLKSSETVTPLSNEIKVVEDYMYLQKMRFEERLRYQVQVEEGTESRMVPSFILQPLVENAVVHGISGKEEGGEIAVRSWTEGAKLWICVSDTGMGMDPEVLEQIQAEKPRRKGGHGIGLGNILKRVRIMYEDGEVQVHSAPGQGTSIKLGFTEHGDGKGKEDGTGEDFGRG